MRDSDSKMIWESYSVNEREYGPSGQPSYNPDDFEITEVYSFNEWPAPDNNPYNDIVAQLERGITSGYDGYVVFYGATEGSETYHQWTDPSIAIGINDEIEPINPAIFVDNDGEGERSEANTQIVQHLLSRDHDLIRQHLDKLNHQY
jgi:hypothetical protein